MKRTSTSSISTINTATTPTSPADLMTIGPDDPADVGQVLRRIRREQPRALLVWIESRDSASRAELISELRRRRPRVPLLALTSDPDARLEQAARIAGASFYLPITCADDQRLLTQALQTLGINCVEPPIPREHSGLPPPSSHGGPEPPGATMQPTLQPTDSKHKREILSGDQS